MKRKIIIACIVIAIILFNILGTKSYAYGMILIESNKNTVQRGEEIEIIVRLRNEQTSAFNFSLSFDSSKWEYISKIENSNVENGNLIYVWYDNSGGANSKTGELIRFKFKAKESRNINF